MAIATLSIDIEAKLATLQDSMDRAAQIAARQGKQLEDAFSGVTAKVAAMSAALAVPAAVMADWVNATIDTTGAMKDMQESFGASLDGLSQIRSGMALSGKSIGDLEGPLNKLVKSIEEAGDSTSDSARAFKALGLDVSKLKSMTPDEVFIAVANASQQYADGTKKAAVMTELFGKEGAKLIPILNDVAEVGGNFTKITQAQVDAADEFDKSMKRLTANFTDFKIGVGNELIPAFNEIIEFTRRAQKELGLFSGTLVGVLGGSGAKLLGIDLDELKRAETEVSDTFKRLTKAKQDLADQQELKRKGLGIGFVVDNNIKNAEEEIKAQAAALKAAIKARDELVKARANGGAPKTAAPDFTAGSTKETKAPKAKKDTTDELGDFLKDAEARFKAGEDAIKRFRDMQLDAAVAGAELTRSEKAFYDLVNSDTWATMSEPMRDLVRDQAELTTVAEKAAQQITRLNELLGATPSAQLEKTRADMQLLADALESGRITAEQFEEAATAALGNVAEKGTDDIQRLIDAINGWSKESADAIASVVMKSKLSVQSLGSILDSIAQKFLAMGIEQQFTGPLFKMLSGAVGGAAAGAATPAAGAQAGDAAGTAFDWLAKMGKSFLGSFDVGTPYVPRTGLALIHQGERILTRDENRRGVSGGGITINVGVTGSVDRRTQAQIGAEVGRQVSRHSNRNG